MDELPAEASSRFRAFAESSMEARISANGSGAIVYVNKRAESLFGYSSEELIGQPLTLLMPERFREAHRSGLERFRTEGRQGLIGQTVELTARRRDGLEFPVELALASWTSSDKDIFFFGNLRDITERKRAEEERQRLLAELRELSSARERLLEDVAHELRGPLTSLGLTIGMYRDLSPDQLDDLMTRAGRTVSRLQGLVDDMLDARGIQAGLFQVNAAPVLWSELSAAALEAVQPLLDNAGQRVECSRPAAGLMVLADRSDVVRAISNLLSNASKYSSSGQAIRLTAEVQGKQLRISVIDPGLGIPLEHQARLFERFYRAPSERQRPGSA
ncbi:MAG: PAS domain S-box protein [Chloroflexota bacterium]